MPLDIFLKVPHNELSKLDAWLYFIASDKIEDIQRVCTAYPEFRELYREVFKFRYHPKELVSMFSEALQILDQNTVQYMIDDLKRQLEEALTREKENQKNLLESQKSLQESQKSSQDKDLIISQLRERLALAEKEG